MSLLENVNVLLVPDSRQQVPPRPQAVWEADLRVLRESVALRENMAELLSEV